jgi:hypothetical protein
MPRKRKSRRSRTSFHHGDTEARRIPLFVRMGLIPSLAVLLTGVSFGQATSPKVQTRATATPTTLLMDWTRGDEHYGPDFISLTAPCSGRESSDCTCFADFKSIQSKFADYITSFPHGRVPVVYEVWRDSRGRHSSAQLERVGDWTSDRFRHGDGLLGVRHTFHLKDGGKTATAKINSPGDCFASPKP